MPTVLDRRQDPAAEPAFGAQPHDVRPVNAKTERDLYATPPEDLSEACTRSLPPHQMAGDGGHARHLLCAALDALESRPRPPDQAVLLDMANNRFFFFFLEIWPQEFYYVTGLLVLGALALFFATSVAGRVWCGYTCPQTVWTDLMITIERFWQGDRNARIRLDKEPWSVNKIVRKTPDAPLLARSRPADRRRPGLLLSRCPDAGARASSPARRQPSPTCFSASSR